MDADHTPSTAEQEAAQIMRINRLNLRRFAEEFSRSVALFQLLERAGGPPSVGVLGGVFVLWRIIAARDGALNIYHFSCSLDAVRQQVPKSTDISKLRTAVKLFNSYFPHACNIRHAIAHAGELVKNPGKIKENIQKADYQSIDFISAAGNLITNALYERTYSVGHEGAGFFLQMDATSIDKPSRVISLVEEAFAD